MFVAGSTRNAEHVVPMMNDARQLPRLVVAAVGLDTKHNVTRGDSVTDLSFNQVLDACSAGGSSALTSVTELVAAGGPHAAVAPARYVDSRGQAIFAYETRFIDDGPKLTVVIDQKQSQLNRVEAVIEQAIADGHPLFGAVPRVEVTYRGDGGSYSDLSLPHRVFDGHIRAGSLDGQPVTASAAYRAARDASPGNARALLEFAPTALVFGGWDSTRRSRQGRYRSALVGEIVGVLSEQDRHAPEPRRGGARVDPVGMSVQLSGEDLLSLVNEQKSELSPKLIEKVEKAAKARAAKGNSGSVLGLGGIPPALESLGAVSCSRIIRTHVLSFAALRQLRFGAGVEGDAACRALLAAYALAGLARSDSELSLRANCDLLESAPTQVRLDARHGQFVELAPLSIDAADAVFEEALTTARRVADVNWSGQVFEVVGNPLVAGSAVADAGEE
ncbi:type I-U CRISPR-associated RAMP protein Csb1/Cas7u [Nocardia sp. NPDC058705]|uniref:type I-G CRISPR-associated RAMP protein Csb1/Cas7g n=1 Tax=Nocardia sp. NPDC058705 TaxID=3346609 RepID=UPI003673D413